MTHTNHATKIRNFDEINWGIPFFCLFHPYNIKNVGKSGHIIPILVHNLKICIQNVELNYEQLARQSNQGT